MKLESMSQGQPLKIQVIEDILSENRRIATENRRLLNEKGVFAVNIMSSPGAGKTSLILQTIAHLREKVRIGVIEGDVASQIDAERIKREGVHVTQINTGGECHLDANMVRSALGKLKLEEIDLLLIENVGNLICPAEFELGEHLKAMISSIPEGDDKPYKYPLMFTDVDALVINKIDLLPYLEFDLEGFRKGAKALNRDIRIFEVSCKTGEGIEEWVDWLKKMAFS